MSQLPFKPVVFLAFANEQQTKTAYLRNLPEEGRRLRATLEKAQAAGLCELVVRTNATLDEILAVFREHRNRIAVFHYGGHASGYALLLESATGEATVAGAGGLATFLSQQAGLQLVFLNGCSTQEQVQGLLHAGVPVVIATSQAIDDEIATEFADQFYRGLASGAKLQTAFKEAEGAVDAAHSGQPRGALYRVHEAMEDRCPWALHVRAGAEVALEWNLPDCVGNPLFDLPGLPEKYLQNLPENPFRGLYWFTQEQAGVFFGRGYQIRKLYQQITAPHSSPIILFYGQSGVGKSSLLAAGLLPRMECSHKVYYLRREPKKDLLSTLQTALAMDVSKPCLAQAWLATEERYHRPLLVVLDQAEEVFTHPNENQPDELANLLDALQTVFADSAHWPQGKLILSFRKEWLAEITRQVEEHRLPYTEAFLQRLDKRGVIDAINGPTISKELQAKYRLEVKEDIPGIIADDLLADRESAVAPTLQILLTKMWDRAKDKCYDQPTFNLDLYDEMRKQGLGLQAVLDQQLAELHEQQPSAVDSGLALDLLAFHTTPLGTAAEHTQEELHQVYAHQQTTLDPLVRGCEDLYLLVDAKENQPKQPPSRRLAHDTLAPLVRQRFDKSDKPGQRARRILESRALDWQAGKAAAVLDEPDLQTVETGVNGMRVWLADEKRLVEESRKEREKRARNRRFWQGIGITAVLLIIIAAAVAGWQWQVAEARRKEAEARREDAYSSALAARAQEVFEKENADLAIALAVEANDSRVTPPQQARRTLANVAYYTPGTRRLFRGHTDKVTSVAFSPAGNTVVSGSADKTVILWDIESGKEIRRFTGHTDSVNSVAFSPKGDSVLSGSADNSLILWNVKTGEQIHRFARHTESVNSIALSPDGITAASGSSDGTILLWNIDTGKMIRRLNGEPGDVINSVAFNPKRQQLVSGSLAPQDDHKVCLWQIAQESAPKCFSWIEWTGWAIPLSVAFNPNGDTVVSGFRGWGLGLWNIDTDEKSWLPAHTGSSLSVAFSPDGRMAASGSNDNSIFLSDIASKSLVQHLVGHSGDVNSIAFSPDGRMLLSSSSDYSLRLWDLAGGAELRRFTGHENVVFDVICLEGGRALSGSADGTIRLWELATGREVHHIDTDNVARHIAISPDGYTVLSVGNSSSDWSARPLHLWDLENEQLIRKFDPGHLWAVVSVAFSPDGHTALSGSYPPSVVLPPQNAQEKAAMLIRWNVDTGRKLASFVGHDGIVTDLAYSSDGHSALSSSTDGTIILWDVSEAKEIQRFQVPNREQALSIAFAPDDRTFLSGSSDNSVTQWDLTTIKPIRRFFGHTFEVKTVDVSADGRLALSGSDDRTVILWDIESSAIIGRFIGHSNGIMKVSFCPDSKTFLSASWDTTIRWWSLTPPDDLIAWTKANRYVHEFTCEERAQYGVEPLCNK